MTGQMESLMKYVGSEDPVFTHPFTMMDRKGAVWTIATDKIWFVAVRGEGTAPRFKGDSTGFFALLNILHYDPKVSVPMPSPSKVNGEEHVCSVLGITVVAKRFQDLLTEAPAESKLWVVDELFPKLPGIGISSEGWKAILMGFENVTGEVSVVDLTPEASLFDLAMGMD